VNRFGTKEGRLKVEFQTTLIDAWF